MQLHRGLTLLHVFSISSGAMFSGLFILPGLAHAQAGPAILISYAIAGLLALTGMLSQAELATAMPKAGGTYFYVTRSMGPAVGSVYGLVTWVSLALKSAYEFVFVGTLIAVLVHINPYLTASVICIIFLMINIVGVREAGRLQTALVLIIMGLLLFYVIRGLYQVDVSHLQPFRPHGWSSVLAAAGFIFISYGGLLKVASVGEEVKQPGRVLPLGMMLSFSVVTVFYMAVIFVTIGIMSAQQLNSSLKPVSDCAGFFLGRWGYVLFSIGGLLAVVSAANTGIMSASRYPFALARDEMLPGALGRVNQRFRTPHLSIIATGVIVIAAMFLPIHTIVKAASSILILTYIFTCLAVIILREGRIQNYQPYFRSPLYPWVQIVGTVGFLVLLVVIGREALLTTAVLVMGGLLLYWFFGRIRATQEYALLHIIERITDRDLTRHFLESELKEIIRERDDLLKDRFDHLIEACHILDIDQPIADEEFFRMSADVMAERLKTDPENLYRQFVEREKESSTVLNPYLAIPHVIIDGEGAFDLLLARCKKGICFSEEAPQVHAVFLLAGTRDERPFHLRSLAAIAQIVHDPSFDKRWMAARSQEALRDVVLLGKRQR